MPSTTAVHARDCSHNKDDDVATSVQALWDYLKHFADIERLALVGERKWEAGMAMFCKPFTRATIRYFDDAQSDEAVRWATEGISQAV